MKYQYKILKVLFGPHSYDAKPENVESDLNFWGEDGWELVGVNPGWI